MTDRKVRVHMKTIFAIAIVVLTLFIGIPTLIAHAATDVLFIGHLDPDALSDTVVGVATGDLRMLPVAINWGVPASMPDGRPDDGATFSSVRTELRYPFGDSTVGSFAIEDVNADRISDVIVFYQSASSDSMRIVALIGQRALHDVMIVDMGAIPRGVQLHPFASIDITSVDLLTDASVRDLSGVLSRSWRSLDLPVRDEPASTTPPSSLADWMLLFPNPASTMATFESGRLSRGEYLVEVVDVNVSVVESRAIVVESERAVTGSVDLATHPKGMYLVRIRSGDRVVATYPVVVVR